MKPNDFLINTNYATLKNDAKATVSISLPASFMVNLGGEPIYRTVSVGEKSAGMHFVFTSSKYSNIGLIASQVLIPCTITYQSTSGQETIDNLLNCYVYRSAPSEVRMEISPNIPGDISGNSIIVTNAEQTISCHISTLINPFEA